MNRKTKNSPLPEEQGSLSTERVWTGTGRPGIAPYLRSRAVYQQKECGQEQEDQEWSRAAQQICPDRINEAIIV